MQASTPHRRRWIALVASLGLMPLAAHATSDAGLITVGASVIPPGNLCVVGYGSGAYSPTGLTGGKTVASLASLITVLSPTCVGNPSSGWLTVSGFSSDPGKSWLNSVACNGITKTGSSASYSYSSGNATWTWTSTDWGFRTNIGNQLGCTIDHT